MKEWLAARHRGLFIRSYVVLAGGLLVAAILLDLGFDALQSRQVRAAINSTLSFTKSNAFLSVRCALLGDIPNNAGVFRCIDVVAPEASVLNPVSPAPEAMVGAPSREIDSRVLISGALKRLTLRGSGTDG